MSDSRLRRRVSEQRDRRGVTWCLLGVTREGRRLPHSLYVIELRPRALADRLRVWGYSVCCG